MRQCLLIGFGALLIACNSNPNAPSNGQQVQNAEDVKARWSIAIHGGAGHFGTESLSSEEQTAYRLSLTKALEAGGYVLEQGGNATDAVVAAIALMEDDSLFNAGRGAVYTASGAHELDASIMRGSDRNCGAVTGLQGFRHPIQVAMSVMKESEHVFFSGHGAGEFALSVGAETAEPAWFQTKKAKARFERALARDTTQEKFGTVGCVALDSQGHLAAGTSTGGMTYKRHGRIGDSPIIGAGTWADDRTCAVSATGWGEFFIRSSVAHDIHARMLHAGTSLEEAASATIHQEMGALGGDGGVVAIDHWGNPVFSMNTLGMFRGALIAGGKPVTALFANEKIQP